MRRDVDVQPVRFGYDYVRGSEQEWEETFGCPLTNSEKNRLTVEYAPIVTE